MGELYKHGLKTEDALFTIASEMVKAQAASSVQSLIGTKVLKKAEGHEIHIHVKRMAILDTNAIQRVIE